MNPLIIEPSREAEAELNSFLDERIYEFNIQATAHSFQAPEFYERLGYVRQATIPNYPQGYAQHVYLKRFGNDDA